MERISGLRDLVFNSVSQHVGRGVREQNVKRVGWLARYCKERISGRNGELTSKIERDLKNSKPCKIGKDNYVELLKNRR